MGNVLVLRRRVKVAMRAVSVASRFDPVLPIIGLAVLGLFGYLFEYHAPIYQHLLWLWMGDPFRLPFVDLHFVIAGVDCWAKGVDVYAHNPCDLLDRPHNYSPLFLRFSFIPTDPDRFVWSVVGVVGGFLVALGALPWPRGWSMRVCALLGGLSPAAAFAVERGNLDMTMFAAATLAGICLCGRFPIRIVGYVIVLGIGLLKIYPLALLVLALRERRVVILGIGAAAAVSLVGYALVYGDELRRMAQNIPTWGPTGIGWGAKSLPMGLNAMLTDIGAPAVFAGLFVASALGALFLAHHPGVIRTIEFLPPRIRVFLALGAAATCGCFFAGQSLPYRAIYLLFSLPGFLALKRAGLYRFGWIASVLSIAALWQDAILRATLWAFGGSPRPIGEGMINRSVWVLSELAWWSLISILMATLIVCLRPRTATTLRQ